LVEQGGTPALHFELDGGGAVALAAVREAEELLEVPAQLGAVVVGERVDEGG
jgi:hypothetical protein